MITETQVLLLQIGVLDNTLSIVAKSIDLLFRIEDSINLNLESSIVTVLFLFKVAKYAGWYEVLVSGLLAWYV